MKFILNGGELTIGTLDGANVETAEKMGRENIFSFGVNVGEVEQLQKRGYNAEDYIRKSLALEQAIEQIDAARSAKMVLMTLMNIASTGEFGTDPTIFGYAREIWGIAPGETSPPATYDHPDGVESSR
ncbi:unnamed protein product [Nippostrongylus brasiliensis]|uniref:Alpha-1,4 glucan phosphorylase n=1 Tax=Nippostrongylus brasiliensis TaxID=27835 RepID=A0A0N4Y8H8_NIPBR|nr:unnamed protein product [Nippostrongylus brasiliensis]